MPCGWARRNQIKPVPGYYDNFDLIEARPGRYIRVTHANLGSSVTEIFTVSTGAAGGGEERASGWYTRRVGYDAPTVCRGAVSLSPQHWIVFLVHGVGGSALVWKHQISYLRAEGYRVVAVDLLGHGGSSRPGRPADYMFKQMAADVLAVFDHYADARGNVLIGHSLGCSISTYVAHKRSYAVSKMVLISSGGPDVLNSTSMCDILCLPNCIFYVFKPCCYCYVRSQMYKKKKRPGSANEARAALEDRRISVDIDVPPSVIKYTLKGQVWLEGDERLHSNLRVDCQLIYGEDDQLVTREDEVRMHQTLPLCRLDIIMGASHMLMLQNADRVNSLINEFLHQPIPAKSEFVKCHISGMLGEDSSETTSHFSASPTHKIVQYHK